MEGRLGKTTHHKPDSKDKNSLNRDHRPYLEYIAEEWKQVPFFDSKENDEIKPVKTMIITVDEAFCHLRSSDLRNFEAVLTGRTQFTGVWCRQCTNS